MEKEYDKAIEDRLVSMMQENPHKLLSYFVSIMGMRVVATNSEVIEISQEMDIEGGRYKVTVRGKVKRIKTKKQP